MIDHAYADLRVSRRRALNSLRPPPRFTLSEWADENFRLSAESSAAPGRWKTLPYQKGILDAITDRTVTCVYVQKSARVGFTKCMNATVGYYIQHAPCGILVVQPTVDGAKIYSKEEIAPMMRDVPVLSQIVYEDAEEQGPKDSGNTILHKRFPGGVLSMVGANSGAGFRSISRKVILFDEVDAYPVSAGSEGDPIKLGTRRSEYFWDRKIIAGSTPLISGRSRIEQLFEEGDQRRYFVPCPHCDHKDFLVFSERADGQGHFMRWDSDDGVDAHFVCSSCGCEIAHHQKQEIMRRGEWRAAKPFDGKASFHIWAAYSESPNASWSQLAKEFLAAKDNPEMLKTFVNTVLGETWIEQGEAPEWERLYNRREQYEIGTVPEQAQFLTAGIDVQKDRCVYEVAGWGKDKQSWSVESGVIPMETSNEADWMYIDQLLNRSWERADGTRMTIVKLAVDSGYNTQMVYVWAKRHPMSRVVAVKGVRTAQVMVGAPSPVDINHRGKRFAKGYKVWPVATDIVKSELYGWLRLSQHEDGTFPAGFCHFPEYEAEFFRQLTAEQLVTSVNERTGVRKTEWVLLPNRENHWLDTRVYNRVAAQLAGLEQIAARSAPAQSVATAPVETAVTVSQIPDSTHKQPAKQVKRENSWLKGSGRSGSWLGKKR